VGDELRTGADIGADDRGAAMHALLVELFPIARSLAGPGIRSTLAALEEVTGPLDRLVFPTGTPVLDWEVPREWTLRRAVLRGPDGSVVADTDDCNLHVVNGSVPVRTRVSLDELESRLFSRPDLPDAIPYRTSYYDEGWGFCLADRVRRALVPGEYEVDIDTDLADGELVVGELVLPGSSSDEVLISTYCCHPSMANNELSGPVVTAFLARWLSQRGPRRYTYRFVFGPETIGAISYLSERGAHLREHLRAGWVVTCVGDPGSFTYKRSRRGDALCDRVAEHVLHHLAPGSEVLDFFATGSDERQYCSPGFDLPVGSLMRSMHGTFREYHTSLDDTSFVTGEALTASLHMYQQMIEVLEANRWWQSTAPYGEPRLGPRGLYPTTGAAADAARVVGDMMHVLNFADGTRDLLGIADRGKRPMWLLVPIAEQLAGAGLLREGDRGGGGA
jgi:aminopeptidase-like protein